MAIPRLAVSTSTGGSAGTTVTTSAIDTTGATLIVVQTSNDASDSSPTVSDSKSNTWTALTARTSTGQSRTQLFYCINPTVGASHTFTATCAVSDHPSIGVQAFVTTKTAVFDAENGASSASATSLASGSITTAEDYELVVIGLGASGQQSSGFIGPIRITSPWAISQDVDLSGGTHYTMLMGYGFAGAAGSYSATWSWPGGATACQAVIAAFKVAAASGGAGGAWAFSG